MEKLFQSIKQIHRLVGFYIYLSIIGPRPSNLMFFLSQNLVVHWDENPPLLRNIKWILSMLYYSRSHSAFYIRYVELLFLLKLQSTFEL